MFESILQTPTGNYSGITNMPPDVAYGSMSLSTNAYNTNFLGGVRMPCALNRDVYASVKAAEARERKGIVNIALGLGTFLVGAFALRKFSKLGKGFASLFSGKK